MVALTSLFLLAGCEADSPLASLKSSTLSTKYNNIFWSSEQQKNSFLWKQATDFCSQQNDGTKPNCNVVNQLVGFSILSNVSKNHPHHGFSSHDVPRP